MAVRKMKTIFFVLGVLFVQQTYAQDCLQPTVSNGTFVGDTTAGGTAAVLCHSGYSGGGPATCSGGVWTVLPGCGAKNCGTTTVANGVLLGDTFYGGTAFVNCNAGYEGGGTATCGTFGTWTSVPGCTAVDCGVAPVNHGSNVGDTTYGGSPFVVCDTGYTGGGAGLTCLQTGAWDIQVSCNPRSCGTPTVTNGVLSGDNFYTGTASIVCNAGYQGGGTATCQSNGQWATLPTCSAKDCGTPTISHGSLSTASSTLFAGSAVVECDSGYTGGGTVVCLNTGNWGTIPACNPVDCGTPTVTNGALTGSTVYSASATVTCSSGYEGGGAATCQANGNWATLPACTPFDCGTPTIANGKLSAGSNTYYGSTATAECNTGYLGGGSVTCLSSGTWTANPSPCTPVDCGTPTIQRGTFSGDTFYTGSASVVCNSGYESLGTAAVCSAGGTWTLPTCTGINCGTLNVTNGVFTGDTFYGGSALVTCNTGYVGSGIATCGSSGTWIVAPTCNARDCGDTSIPHSTLIGSTLYNEGAFITCNAGYSGGGTATCLSIGVWGPPLPTCTPKDCGTPTITNGALSADSSTLYDGTATVECNSGYEGGGTATCQTTATWATLPTCDLVDCGKLTDPAHGSVNYTATTYQNVATYLCDPLWQLSGSNTQICEANGNWAPDPPTCNDIDCGMPMIANGALTGSTLFAGSAKVMCNTGYEGGGALICQANGTWASLPACYPVDCGIPTIQNGKLSTESDTYFGGSATAECNAGYYGGGTITCHSSGTWTVVPTVCTPFGPPKCIGSDVVTSFIPLFRPHIMEIITQGYPEPETFTWYRKSSRGWSNIGSEQNIIIVSSGVQSNLTIHNVTDFEYEEYGVTAFNGLPDDRLFTKIFYIYRQGKPEQPTNFRCVLNSSITGSVIVEWTPGRNGGFIQTFVIQYQIKGDTSWKQNLVEDKDTLDETMNVVLDDLDRNSVYVFKMLSMNAAGNSSMTREQIIITPGNACASSEARDNNEVIVVGTAFGGVLVGAVLSAVALFVCQRARNSKTNGDKQNPYYNETGDNIDMQHQLEKGNNPERLSQEEASQYEDLNQQQCAHEYERI